MITSMDVNLLAATTTHSVACNGKSRECNLPSLGSKKNGPKEVLATVNHTADGSESSL